MPWDGETPKQVIEATLNGPLLFPSDIPTDPDTYNLIRLVSINKWQISGLFRYDADVPLVASDEGARFTTYCSDYQETSVFRIYVRRFYCI